MSRLFFDRFSSTFDQFYSENKGFVRSWVDRRFRRSMAARYTATMDYLRDRAKGSRILDIGCGSGRYSVELAAMGAEVVGVDESRAMLDLARAAAAKAGVDGRCSLVHAPFQSFEAGTPFDYSIAIGLFDYIFDPASFLAKVRSLTRKGFLASFPVRWHWLTPQRKIRYYLRGFPVRFYDETGARNLVEGAGFKIDLLERADRDYFIAATVARYAKNRTTLRGHTL